MKPIELRDPVESAAMREVREWKDGLDIEVAELPLAEAIRAAMKTSAELSRPLAARIEELKLAGVGVPVVRRGK